MWSTSTQPRPSTVIVGVETVCGAVVI